MNINVLPFRGRANVSLFRRHIDAVTTGGLPVLGGKIVSVSGMALAIPLVLLVRLLRPVVAIRFLGLPTQRIGPFAGALEIYLCELDAGFHGRRVLDVYYHHKLTCNHQLKKMWDRILHVWPFAIYMARANSWLPGGKAHRVPWRNHQDYDFHGLLEKTPPHLSFTAEEEELGQSGLRSMGIPEGSPFVCLHVRDASYLKAAFPGTDTSAHDFRDSDVRDYLEAAEELTKRGLYVIRLGSIVQGALETANSMIIDYASKFRTDFLDMYLIARCKFYVSSGTGLATGVGTVFRIPRVYVNWGPLELLLSSGENDLMINKKMWHRGRGVFLGYREIMDSGMGMYQHKDQFEQSGVDVVNNSPQEITDAVIEMEERIRGTWESQGDDEELQSRFWSLFQRSPLHPNIQARYGAKFLRQNRELVE